jgi:hypothetical protein
LATISLEVDMYSKDFLSQKSMTECYIRGGSEFIKES